MKQLVGFIVLVFAVSAFAQLSPQEAQERMNERAKARQTAATQPSGELEKLRKENETLKQDIIRMKTLIELLKNQVKIEEKEGEKFPKLHDNEATLDAWMRQHKEYAKRLLSTVPPPHGEAGNIIRTFEIRNPDNVVIAIVTISGLQIEQLDFPEPDNYRNPSIRTHKTTDK